ncbi:hypothetical protein B0T14DRAFT_491061 [Immersiella caudata]|uniref:Uncharacterized protein n=1 Tax=Immersiella caudata TaxID=314043 RepID=A0AA40CBY7_9PEZI|nr:hypothetical protein B0T14DRAFT_491061 [Immersiella caudata]
MFLPRTRGQQNLFAHNTSLQTPALTTLCFQANTTRNMFPTRSRPVTALTARPAALAFAGNHASHSRGLSQLTMGFEDIAKWKAEKRKRASPNYHAENKTVFDIRIDTPSHKSSAWNISYEVEPSTPVQKPVPTLPTSAPRHSPARTAGQTRKFTSQATAGAIKRILPAQAPAQECNLPHHPIFGGERTSAQITDVPDLAVLSRLDAKTRSAAPQLPPIVLLDQVITKRPEDRGLFQVLRGLLPFSSRSSGGGNTTPTAQEATFGLLRFSSASHGGKEKTDEGRELPRVPRQESNIDTQAEEDKLAEIKRELPMFLGGGPS